MTHFSESWQEQATPTLTGPSGGTGGGNAQTGGGTTGSGWHAEARRFSGRARALSNQLGQLARSSSDRETEASRKKGPKAASASRASAKANSNPGTPSDPSQVPIGGLGWLAPAGVAYALRRLGLRAGKG